jgi:hypothetical protein
MAQSFAPVLKRAQGRTDEEDCSDDEARRKHAASHNPRSEYRGRHNVWTVQQYLVYPKAVMRCSICGVERTGDSKQAARGQLRCWTCVPKPPPTPPRRTPRAIKLREAKGEPTPKVPAAPRPPPMPRLPPLPGRVSQPTTTSYTRVVRYQVEEEGDRQHGRIEILGLRTKNPMNQRASWQAVKGWAEAARRFTMEALELSMPRPPDGHPYAYELTLTRVSTKRTLDDDGVTAALKGVRDAFSIFVHVNDGDRGLFRTTYRIGHGRVQGVVVEWKRRPRPLPAEDAEGGFLFYDDDELTMVAGEHRVTRQYWKERMRKRLLSIASRPTGGDGDEAEEEAAYDVAEDEGEDETHETDGDG